MNVAESATVRSGWKWAGLVALGLGVHAILGAFIGLRRLSHLYDATYWVASGFAAWVLLRARRQAAPRSPRLATALGCMAAAQAFFAAGDAVWAYVSLIERRNPFPSRADVFYLAFYPLFAAGILMVPHPRLRREDRWVMMLDMSVLLLSAGLLLGVTVLRPFAALYAAQLAATYVTVAYVAADLMLLYPLARLSLCPGPAVMHRGLLLLMATAGARILLDSWLGYRAVMGIEIPGALDRFAWVVLYALTAAAGLVLAGEPSHDEPPQEPPAEAVPWPSSWATWGPLSAIVLSATLLLGVGWTLLQEQGRWLVMIGGALTVLTLCRQGLTLWDHRRLLTAARRHLAERQRAEAELSRAYAEMDRRVVERTAACEAAIAQLRAEIEERRAVESALRRSEERYRCLAEASQDMIFIVNKDGVVQYANPFACRLIQRPLADLVGVSIAHLFPQSWQRQLDSIRRVLDTGSPLWIETLTEFPGGRLWLDTTLAPICDDGGRPQAVLGISRDISERKREEQALRESEQRFRSLFDESPDAIFVEDLEGRVLDGNPAACRLHKMTREELIGKNVLDLVPPMRREQVRADFPKLISGEWKQFESSSWTSDGEEIPVELHATLIQYSDRPALLIHVRDIRARKQLDEERRRLDQRLQETQKLESLGVMAGGIAHDFNNLLLGVLGNLELALSDLPSEWPQREYLRAAQRSAQKGAELCRQMLAYAGRAGEAMQPVDLNHVITDMESILAATVGKRALLRFDLARGLPPIMVDAAQLRQTVLNLVTNACEALQAEGGVVAVKTGASEGSLEHLTFPGYAATQAEGLWAFVEVADTGVGMTEAIRSRIFEPFFTTKFRGRGLGLAAVLGIVKAHGGGIRVISHPGEGTTVRVFFPMAPSPPRPETRPPAAEQGTQSAVLLVDDEETLRALGKEMLERLGYEVFLAQNGEEALRIVERERDRIICVLLDLTMPQMDGAETLTRLRQIAPAVRVVLCSGFDEHHLAERLSGHHADAFLAKPYTLEILARTVKEVVGRG